MLTKLLNIGVTENLDFYQKREVKIINLFSFITLLGLLIGATNIFFLKSSYPYLPIFAETLATLLVLLLNAKKYNQTATYLFVISLNLNLVYINHYYDVSTGSYLYYLPIIFCVALLHNPERPVARVVILLSVIAFCFFLSRFVSLPFIPKANITKEQNDLIFDYNINLCAGLTIILVYLIINLINRQNRELTDLLRKSHTDQVTITNSLKEKEVLLAEIQHRVKNNLSVLIGLFNLQKDSATNEETRQSMMEAKNRVLSIAMVHERLYRKEDLSKINLKHYIAELAKEIVRGHPLHGSVTVVEELESLDADITKAVPIGLIVNEIVTNSLKHAFGENSKDATIKITLNRQFDQVCLKIQDNGKGFSPDMERSDRSLGLTLIESLAEQLDGDIHYASNGGATVKLAFPV